MLDWKAQTDRIRRQFINTVLQNRQRDVLPTHTAHGLLTNFIRGEVLTPLSGSEENALSHCFDQLFEKLDTTAIDTGFATSFLARITEAAVNERDSFNGILQQC